MSATEPTLSVVVIVYNDAARLPRAVRSALRQTLRSLEVVIVDDASTDGTAAVAERLVARHPDRVRLHRLPENSGGCSRPRNTGIELARGRYVMFLDSDDDLPRDAAAVLVDAAEEARADFSAGRCVRVHVNKGMRTTPWYHWLYTSRVVYRSVLENPDLIYDTLSTNKCYRREFLERHHLRFPDGYHYEDLLFSAHAYLAAERIALVPDVVYRWHVVDDTETPSISNRRAELRNFTDRVRIQRMIDEAFAARGATELKLVKDVKFLRHDLRLYIGDLAFRDEEFRRAFFSAAKDYLLGLDPRAFERAPAVPAIVGWLITHDDERNALTAIDYVAHGGKLSTRLVERGGRVYWCAEHLDSPEGQAVLDVTELNFQGRSLSGLDLYDEVDELAVDGTVLRLSGRIVNQLDRIPADASLRLELLVNPRRHRDRPIAVPAVSVRHEGATLRWTAELDLRHVVHATGLVDRVWDIRPRLTVGQQVNVGRLSTRDPAHNGVRLPVRPRLGRLAADHLATLVTPEGDLALEFVPAGRVARSIHRAGQRVVYSHTARRAGEARRRIRKALRDPRHPRLREEVFRRTLRWLPARRGLAVFESEGGTRFTGNPRAIYEEIRRRELDVPAVWAHSGRTDGFPSDAALVRHGSLRYFAALARAAIWVDDRGFPVEAVKRPGTLYLQTWSGTPLQWVGFDAGATRRAANAARMQMRKQVDKWDALLARAPYDAETLTKAYRLSLETLPFGYPRNDPLVAGGDGLDDLRARLGIRGDQQVVLHIPSCNKTVFEPDASVLAGHRQVLVVRPTGAVWRRKVTAVPGVIGAESVDDVTSLLLLADVLVTDHHSSLFDFALLRRPILLVGCRCGVRPSRGSNAEAYLDIDAIAPSPAAWSADQLAAQLADLPGLRERQAERLDRLAATYGAHETGKAAAQAVDWLFRERT